MPTFSSATSPHQPRSWEISPTKPIACWSGTGALNGSRTMKRPTGSCRISTARRTSLDDVQPRPVGPLWSGDSMFTLRAVLFLAASAMLFAQDPRGAIAGRVIDKSDAVLVGAKVEVTNVQTGVTAGVKSNETGNFRIPFLTPGTYRLTAGMAGFKTYSQPSLEVRVGDTLDLAIRLDVGDTS